MTQFFALSQFVSSHDCNLVPYSNLVDLGCSVETGNKRIIKVRGVQKSIFYHISFRKKNPSVSASVSSKLAYYFILILALVLIVENFLISKDFKLF